MEAKNLMQSSAKFCEVFALKFAYFLCPQNCSALFVGRASTFMIFRPPNIHCILLISERKKVEKKTISNSRSINVKDT